MQSDLFDSVAEQLEQITNLDRLEARGTLRLAVKQAGLDAKALTLRELAVIFEKVMPAELKARGIESPADICTTLIRNLSHMGSSPEATPSTIDDVFGRLGGRA
jgi:hypothetical protein